MSLARGVPRSWPLSARPAHCKPADECYSKVQTPQGATVKQLDFTPMDAFISHVLEAFRMDAETAVQVFPPSARVVLSFCERVANDVVSNDPSPRHTRSVAFG